MNPKAMDSADMLLMGLEFSHKPGVDLIRNCDLPPPQKIFTGMARVKDRERDEAESGGVEEKLELLKALRLSQTRAREAERKAAKLMEERDCISRAFEDEARLIFFYRQSVKLLQLRLSNLQKMHDEEESRRNGDSDAPAAGGGGGGEAMKWVWALAICFTVVGVGFLYGYTCNVDEDPILNQR
ncbi:uncharacterized protein LOC111008325 [Momordica charantia]|uniref:Uncharacterized protein LOC111008325 n=1 Tax=Momordica charantia TaxID=3673 RepID=A0A6J1C873_MOMCH|nr:uncharacterized protein LOC111008325 [Momordica charantia]